MGYQDQAIQSMLKNSNDLMPLQKQQMQFGLDTARTAYDQSQADRNWMLGRRQILTNAQDAFADKVDKFDTDAEVNKLGNRALADNNFMFGQARGTNNRAAYAAGLNPASGRMMAMNNQLLSQQALAGLSAANKVREAARQEGFNLQAQKANMFSGFPAMGMQATSAGAGFGMSGLSTANAGLAGMNSGFNASGGMAGSMGQNASGMYGAMGSYKNGADQLASQQADPFGSMLGQGVGAFATAYGTKMAMSDRRLKTDIKRVGVLDNGLPVYSYKYVMGGPTVIGVMADEVAQVVPEAYVPNAVGDFAAVDYSKL
jgi:hypothetical protein